MYYRNLTAIAAATVAILSSSATLHAADFPKGSPAFYTNHAAALKASEESGKPLVLIFSATWCGPCQANKRRVYPSKEVLPYHDKFVWAYLDADDEANFPAMDKAGVSGIPHIEILNQEQKRLNQSVGMMTPAEFAETLSKSLSQLIK